MGKATQDLRKEHESILYVLNIMDRMFSSNTKTDESLLGYYDEVVYFLKIFADKCHHGKEENYLFPQLVQHGAAQEGGPVGVMLQEHAQGRTFIAMMSAALEYKNLEEFNSAASQYQELLRKHIEKENSVLFVMADRVLDEAAQDELFEKFEQHEENVVGHGIHEKLHGMIHAWAETFPN